VRLDTNILIEWLKNVGIFVSMFNMLLLVFCCTCHFIGQSYAGFVNWEENVNLKLPEGIRSMCATVVPEQYGGEQSYSTSIVYGFGGVSSGIVIKNGGIKLRLATHQWTTILENGFPGTFSCLNSHSTIYDLHSGFIYVSMIRGYDGLVNGDVLIINTSNDTLVNDIGKQVDLGSVKDQGGCTIISYDDVESITADRKLHFIGGGADGLNVDIYSLNTGFLTTGQSSPSDLYVQGCMLIDQNIYTYGGVYSESTVLQYDIGDNSWTDWGTTNYILGNYFPSFYVAPNLIYIPGGYISGGADIVIKINILDHAITQDSLLSLGGRYYSFTSLLDYNESDYIYTRPFVMAGTSDGNDYLDSVEQANIISNITGTITPQPSNQPTNQPTVVPTLLTNPTAVTSYIPTYGPTDVTTRSPTTMPTRAPTNEGGSLSDDQVTQVGNDGTNDQISNENVGGNNSNSSMSTIMIVIITCVAVVCINIFGIIVCLLQRRKMKIATGQANQVVK